MPWQKVAKISDFDGLAGQLVEVSGQKIALLKHAGSFYAIENHCCHKGGPLVEGNIQNGAVTCSWHAWSFDLASGQCKNNPAARQKVYPTKTEGSDLFVEI